MTIIHLDRAPPVPQAGPENTEEEESTHKTTENKPEDDIEEEGEISDASTLCVAFLLLVV